MQAANIGLTGVYISSAGAALTHRYAHYRNLSGMLASLV